MKNALGLIFPCTPGLLMLLFCLLLKLNLAIFWYNKLGNRPSAKRYIHKLRNGFWFRQYQSPPEKKWDQDH